MCVYVGSLWVLDENLISSTNDKGQTFSHSEAPTFIQGSPDVLRTAIVQLCPNNQRNWYNTQITFRNQNVNHNKCLKVAPFYTFYTSGYVHLQETPLCADLDIDRRVQLRSLIVLSHSPFISSPGLGSEV